MLPCLKNRRESDNFFEVGHEVGQCCTRSMSHGNWEKISKFCRKMKKNMLGTDLDHFRPIYDHDLMQSKLTVSEVGHCCTETMAHI